MSVERVVTGEIYLLKETPTLHGVANAVYVSGPVAVEAVTIDLYDETVLVKVTEGDMTGLPQWVDLTSLEELP